MAAPAFWPAEPAAPDLAAWQAGWRALLGREGDASLCQALIARYSEPHRHYHTLQHLGECLAHWQGVRHLAQRPGEVALALWFHDAVYDIGRHDNEARSADWARRATLDAGLAAGAADRVHALVMATRHDAEPTEADQRLLVDVDLAILGAPPGRFDEYERQIRAEYAPVPAPQFAQGRRRILEGLLARGSLYGTAWFRDRLEQPARANLRRALDSLGG